MMYGAGSRRQGSISPARAIFGRMAARLIDLVHRLAWCAIQWRVWLREARCAGRRLVVSRPCTDPLKRREECCTENEYHSDSEKHEGDGVAVPFVSHEGNSTLS